MVIAYLILSLHLIVPILGLLVLASRNRAQMENYRLRAKMVNLLRFKRY